MQFMVNEIHTNFKAEWGLRLADGLTANVFYRLCWVYLHVASLVESGSRNREAVRMIVVLMGVTGSGKTTVGKVLATELGWKFYDADVFHAAANTEKMHR